MHTCIVLILCLVASCNSLYTCINDEDTKPYCEDLQAVVLNSNLDLNMTRNDSTQLLTTFKTMELCEVECLKDFAKREDTEEFHQCVYDKGAVCVKESEVPGLSRSPPLSIKVRGLNNVYPSNNMCEQNCREESSDAITKPMISHYYCQDDTCEGCDLITTCPPEFYLYTAEMACFDRCPFPQPSDLKDNIRSVEANISHYYCQNHTCAGCDLLTTCPSEHHLFTTEDECSDRCLNIDFDENNASLLKIGSKRDIASPPSIKASKVTSSKVSHYYCKNNVSCTGCDLATTCPSGHYLFTVRDDCSERCPSRQPADFQRSKNVVLPLTASLSNELTATQSSLNGEINPKSSLETAQSSPLYYCKNNTTCIGCDFLTTCPSGYHLLPTESDCSAKCPSDRQPDRIEHKSLPSEHNVSKRETSSTPAATETPKTTHYYCKDDVSCTGCSLKTTCPSAHHLFTVEAECAKRCPKIVNFFPQTFQTQTDSVTKVAERN